MSNGKKKIYRFLAWFFSVIVAAGTFVGCRMKYGPPPQESKYGPPASGYNNQIQKNVVDKNV